MSSWGLSWWLEVRHTDAKQISSRVAQSPCSQSLCHSDAQPSMRAASPAALLSGRAGAQLAALHAGLLHMRALTLHAVCCRCSGALLGAAEQPGQAALEVVCTAELL